MAQTTVLVWAMLHPGHHPDEVFVIAGPDHSAFVDVTQVQPSRLILAGQDRRGQVVAFVIEQGQWESLVELSGVAVGALRGWVHNERIRPLS
jgi:hypothetical protein